MEKPTAPTKNPPYRYFLKELISNKVWSTKGYAIPFEDIGDDTGLLVTNHPGLIEEIEIAISRRRGGIREILESEVEEVKKKAYDHQMHRNELSTNRFDKARVASTRPFNPNPSPANALAVGAEVAKPAPVPPGQPLDPVPAIDPALLRPKPTKRKLREAAEAISSSPPMTPVAPPTTQ